VALIAAEDTRTTRILLQHYQINTPLTSYHEHNKLTKLDAIFETLASADVALVSDAGTPGISDPGYELVLAAIERGVRVEPLPGANAVIPALVGSGLATDSFVYLGFLPRKDKPLRTLLDSLRTETRTLVAYESPNRLTDTLQAALDVLGDRRVCVARELSKKFEEFRRGTLSEVLAHYLEQSARGEITLVLEGATPQPTAEWDAAQVRAALDERIAAGDTLSSAARAVAARSGWPRREVYALAQDGEG
ncbi:MAG: 16S rRNA (cytidine(1402)-2'-O)-methyltransferase, partial [Anaerolineae bacterium]|nr:16S rRNA (cytidine(1402)-2'-O)-methyltransferase [Anaerolineae bacterium]